jgi:hypothetical protein
VFNLLPGGGLGFTGSKEIAFGLGAMDVTPVTIPRRGRRSGATTGKFNVYDNVYSRKKDEKELVEFLTIIFQVIE